MDSKFNLNGIWRMFSQTGNETMSLSVYQGTASITVFKKGSESRRPVVKMPVSGAATIQICSMLKALLNAQPETRLSFMQLTFNKDSRSYEQQTSMVFFKDEKRCYGIEISNKFVPTPVKFMFRCPSTFAFGSEPMTDEQKSTLGLKEFLNVMENLTMTCMLSRFNMEPPQRQNGRGGDNRGGGNNYQRRDNGGSQDPYRGGSEEDSIFG